MSQSRQELLDQYAEIAELAGGLAHEIKNPLSTIRLNMDLLAEDLDGAELPAQRRALRKVETVKQECSRLEELLNAFLDFSRSHALQLEPRDVNKQLRDLLDFYRPQAKAAGIELIEYYANNLPAVRLDGKSFRRAVLNLLLNAQQAMPEGGQLVVRTRTSGNEVAVDLIDTGCGMNEQSAAKVFDAFYSTKPGGSGLGMSIVRKIVEAHGGRILLQSEPNRGTQFTLLFPSLNRLLPGSEETLAV